MSSLVFVGVAGLLLAFLVPHLVRHRQQLLDSRTDDRYSADLRVLAKVGKSGGAGQRSETIALTASHGADGAGRVHLLTQSAQAAASDRVPDDTAPEGTRREEPIVHRPYGVDDSAAARIADDVAAYRDRLDQQRAARVKAAKRRLGLTALLAVVAIGGWGAAAAGLGVVAIATGATGTVLLAGVLGLGRRAVVLNERTDAENLRGLHELQRQAKSAADYAARRRSAPTTVADFAETEVTVEIVEQVETDRSWTPTPVPAPMYTMKARAPRMAVRDQVESDQVEDDDAGMETASSTEQPGEPGQEVLRVDVSEREAVMTISSMSIGERSDEAYARAKAVAQASAAQAAKDAARRVGAPSAVKASLDLNAILERRRASGE